MSTAQTGWSLLTRRATRLALALAALTMPGPAPAIAQAVSQRGFVELKGVFFSQDAPNDSRSLVGDVLVREEVFVKPFAWIQFAGGLDARANSYDQVERSWRLDVRDRGVRRPSLSLRRVSTTLTKGPLTVNLGKQFIRWGKANLVTPTDRFAPRDFLNVVDGEFLAVTGARVVGQFGPNTLEAAWVPFLTPSRTPLLDQRWTVVPPTSPPLSLVDVSADPPQGAQGGVRWAHTGAGSEYSLSYFDGFNTLPNVGSRPGSTPTEILIARTYPTLRSYGADAAIPLPWLTVKAETAYFTSSSPATDEYVLYVVQAERQSGEWLFLAGYAGEVVTARRAGRAFAPDRGLTRSFVGRASYTVDANRSIALEGVIRQNADGFYLKGEYSQARGRHWRATVAAAAIGGSPDDFLGQYRRNSHLTAALRYSF